MGVGVGSCSPLDPSSSRMTLVRGLSRGHLTALSVNCVIGAGILGLPSRAFALSGDYSLMAWLVCAVLVAGIALCFAEVADEASTLPARTADQPPLGQDYGPVEHAERD